jgi:5-hydroxyisourate hydrolase-like protein (transthyretin family)
MGTMLNTQFMCMVERIVKIRFMLVLQVAQHVSCKIEFYHTPLLVSVYLMHVIQRVPSMPTTSYTGQ